MINFFSALSIIILETAGQGAKVIQDPELQSFSIGVEHSQKVKATPIEIDCGSRDCVNLAPSIAVSRIIGSSMDIESINSMNSRCYDAKADYWDRMPFEDFLPAQILRHYNPAAGPQTLEIGSGTGKLAEWLAEQGFDLLCIDPSNEMVERSRAKNLYTLQTTIQKFSNNEKFGLISAVLSLIHIPKNEMAEQLQRIHSWLHPQGIFALALIQGSGEGVEKNSPYPRFFSYYTRQEILDLTKNDFKCVFERQTDGPISYLVFIFQKL